MGGQHGQKGNPYHTSANPTEENQGTSKQASQSRPVKKGIGEDKE